MKIACPSCGAQGRFDESRLSEAGAYIRCPRCEHRFLVEKGEARPGELPAADQESCSLCRNLRPREEMLRFGESRICAFCKPDYVQILRQGLAQPGEQRYGGFWIRFAAKFLDGLIQYMIVGVLVFPVVFLFGVSTPEEPEFGRTLGMTLFQLAAQLGIPAVYTVFFLGRYQATPGKMACGLKVIRSDMSRVGYLRALGRHFAEMLSHLILAIGYLMAAFDDEKRALHDHVCDTRVVYR